MDDILDQEVMGDSDYSSILTAGSGELNPWSGSWTTRLNYRVLSYSNHASQVPGSFPQSGLWPWCSLFGVQPALSTVRLSISCGKDPPAGPRW